MFDVTPFLEMSSYDLFCLSTNARFFDTPDIKCTVLSCKSADTTHVVAIVGKLVARKAVLARIGQRAFWVRERVQVLTLPAIGTASAGKKETAIAYAGCVCARQAGIFLDAAARLRFCFAARDKLAHDVSQTKAGGYVLGVIVLPVAASPLVIPYIYHRVSINRSAGNTRPGHALYSFPVCGAVSLSTSPGFTCFRAGFSFFCFGTTAFAACASICVSVLLLLIVSFEAESPRTLKS